MPCKQVMTDAGVKPEDIGEVVLVGGSTRIPSVRRLVDSIFNLSARKKSRTPNSTLMKLSRLEPPFRRKFSQAPVNRLKIFFYSM